jgi:hypothetical protein
MRFLDHTQQRTTVSRTPLDEWSDRRKDFYLTTHDTQERQTSMPPTGFESTNSAGERPHTYALDRPATRTGNSSDKWPQFQTYMKKNKGLRYTDWKCFPRFKSGPKLRSLEGKQKKITRKSPEIVSSANYTGLHEMGKRSALLFCMRAVAAYNLDPKATNLLNVLLRFF